ncbi:MAG: hypothetical protein ACUVR2_03405 [Anaerolineae bacterium]
MVQEQEFRFREWLESGAKGMCSWVTRKRFLPEAFWEHSRAAGREVLLAVRSLLDAAIEKVESKPEKRVTKIKVEKAE